MISYIGWIIIIFILLIIKFAIIVPLEDKKKYKENAKKDEELFNRINKIT